MQATFNQEFDLFFGTHTDSAALDWVANLEAVIDAFGAAYLDYIDMLHQFFMTLPFHDYIVDSLQQICMWMCSIGEIEYSYFSAISENIQPGLKKLRPVGDLIVESFIQIAKAKTMVYVHLLDMAQTFITQYMVRYVPAKYEPVLLWINDQLIAYQLMLQ